MYRRPLLLSTIRRQHLLFLLTANCCGSLFFGVKGFAPIDNRLHTTTTNSSPLHAAASNNMQSNMKLDSPAAHRNKDLIWQILRDDIIANLGSDDTINVLEIAAGTGIHTAHFCQEWKSDKFKWYPTDMQQTALDSISAYCAEVDSVEKIARPEYLELNAKGIADPVPLSIPEKLDLMICINMIHISPWTSCIGLMQLAEQRLQQGGYLYMYGPYKVNSQYVESNRQFDESLRMRNADWGIRNLEEVVKTAEACGLTLVKVIEMPANNLSVIFNKE